MWTRRYEYVLGSLSSINPQLYIVINVFSYLTYFFVGDVFNSEEGLCSADHDGDCVDNRPPITGD